jgi:hypothetical protein
MMPAALLSATHIIVVFKHVMMHYNNVSWLYWTIIVYRYRNDLAESIRHGVVFLGGTYNELTITVSSYIVVPPPINWLDDKAVWSFHLEIDIKLY